MERKVYNRLLEWKEKDAGSCVLLLDGARRVGKSFFPRIALKNLLGQQTILPDIYYSSKHG